MQIITVELLNEHALSLLRQLEQLNVLRLVTEVPKEKPKKKWAGKLSAEEGDRLMKQLEEIRAEWERNI